MDRQCENSANGYGLLANGSSRLWDVAIDESSCRENLWICEFDGPDFYVAFELADLNAVGEMLAFLERSQDGGRSQSQPPPESDGETLVIGRFGPAPVALVRDDEDPDRCFLVVGPSSDSTNPVVGEPAFVRPATMRRVLRREDVAMWIEALRQVAEDLAQVP